MRKLLVTYLYIEISLSKTSLILYRISEVNVVYLDISCTCRTGSPHIPLMTSQVWPCTASIHSEIWSTWSHPRKRRGLNLVELGPGCMHSIACNCHSLPVHIWTEGSCSSGHQRRVWGRLGGSHSGAGSGCDRPGYFETGWYYLSQVDEASTAHRQVSDGSCVRHEADRSGQEAGFCRIRKTRWWFLAGLSEIIGKRMNSTLNC